MPPAGAGAAWAASKGKSGAADYLSAWRHSRTALSGTPGAAFFCMHASTTCWTCLNWLHVGCLCMLAGSCCNGHSHCCA